MKITLLADNPGSWIVPFAKNWVKELRALGHTAVLVHDHSGIQKGDALFLLGCEKKLSARISKRNSYNLVVHESDLPKGKGWSPLTWQILEGKTKIPITLFKASEKIDGGEIYQKRTMRFRGDELIEELRDAQAAYTWELMLHFIGNYKTARFVPQKGRSTFYQRRKPDDSRLNVQKSLRDQFDLFRVADNSRYPVFFKYRGQKYILKIYKREMAAK